MSKKSMAEKEKALLEKIKLAKTELSQLQKKQKEEIGTLAYKYSLNELPIEKLEVAFRKIKDEHLSESA